MIPTFRNLIFGFRQLSIQVPSIAELTMRNQLLPWRRQSIRHYASLFKYYNVRNQSSYNIQFNLPINDEQGLRLEENQQLSPYQNLDQTYTNIEQEQESMKAQLALNKQAISQKERRIKELEFDKEQLILKNNSPQVISQNQKVNIHEELWRKNEITILRYKNKWLSQRLSKLPIKKWDILFLKNTISIKNWQMKNLMKKFQIQNPQIEQQSYKQLKRQFEEMNRQFEEMKREKEQLEQDLSTTKIKLIKVQITAEKLKIQIKDLEKNQDSKPNHQIQQQINKEDSLAEQNQRCNRPQEFEILCQQLVYERQLRERRDNEIHELQQQMQVIIKQEKLKNKILIVSVMALFLGSKLLFRLKFG